MNLPQIEKWPQRIELTQNAILRLFTIIFIILTYQFIIDIVDDDGCLTTHQFQQFIKGGDAQQ